MSRRNSFEMAAHDFEMRWPTSWEREMHLERMEMRKAGNQLVESLKELNQVVRTFNQLLK